MALSLESALRVKYQSRCKNCRVLAQAIRPLEIGQHTLVKLEWFDGISLKTLKTYLHAINSTERAHFGALEDPHSDWIAVRRWHAPTAAKKYVASPLNVRYPKVK